MKKVTTFEKNKYYMSVATHRVFKFVEETKDNPDHVWVDNICVGKTIINRDSLVPLPVDQAGGIIEELVYSDPEASGWYMLDFTMFGEDLSCPAYFNAGDKTWYSALKGEKPVMAIPLVDIREWNPMATFQR